MRRFVSWLLLALIMTGTTVSVSRAQMESRAAATTQLAAVKAWDYQLQSYSPEALEALATADTDLIVIDYQGDSGAPFTTDQIARLKQKPEGGRRLVLAYLSIGEAEEYRFYWQAQWGRERPSFIISENCRWPTNHLVRFWVPQWRELMVAAPDSYLGQIQVIGFDGVYLDRVDIHNDIRRRFPDAARQMKRFVADLAATARARQPGFIVVAQNAEELLADEAYRAVIDAVAKEDLLHGVFGTGKRNPQAMIDGSLRNLRRLRADRKPVFAVEYLARAGQITAARSELEGLGITAVFPTRALDGRDPVRDADNPGRPRHGTPEYAAENCDGVFPKGR